MRVHAVSAAGLDLIKTFEGFRAEPEPMHGGGWVVGYAHLRIAEAGEAMSEEDAAAALQLDLAPVERFVNSVVTADINQGQYDALVSFCFSIGVVAFEKSDVLRKVNANQFVEAACAMDAWRKSSVGGESEIFEQLIRRRAAEKALFLKAAPAKAAPSVFLRAELDHAAAILGAPVGYAELPALNAAPKKVEEAAANVREKIAEILKREPQTTLVLTQRVDADEAVEEITTANARPVARKLRPDLVVTPERKPRFTLPGWMARTPAQTAGLFAFFAFGVGLVALGVSLWLSAAGVGDVFAGAMLAAPGALCAAMAIYGVAKGPSTRAAA